MRVKFIVRFALLLLLIFIIVKFRNDLSRSFDLFLRNFNFRYSALVIPLTIVTFLNEPLRWWLFLRGVDPFVKLGKVYHMTTITSLISYAFPARLGMPARIILSKRILKIDMVTAGSVIGMDSFLAYCLWTAMALLGAVVVLPEFDISPIYFALVVLLVGCLVVGLLIQSRVNVVRYWPRLEGFFLSFSNP